MIKTRHLQAFWFLTLVSSMLFLCSGAVLAQDKKAETKTTDDGYGGKITTTYSEYEGKSYVEKFHRNAKGELKDKTTETTGPDGTVEEIETYDLTNGGKIAGRFRYEKDRTGEIVRSQIEHYKDGVLYEGEISVRRPGDEFQTTVQTWSPYLQSYQDVPPSIQEKERAELKRIYDRGNRFKSQFPYFGQVYKDGKISYEGSGTGETIGHVADITFKNLTNETVSFAVPPAILESKAGGNQDYVCPTGQDVVLGPGETKTVPFNGTCLERDRPPEGSGQRGDVVLNEGDFERADSATHFRPEVVRNVVDMVEAKQEAVDKLEEDGKFKDFPYHDKQEQENIAVQWSTWEDPRISDLVHAPPADKDDFKRNIDHQAKRHGKVPRDVQKQLDKGTDSMWDAIELTSEKAKDLESTPAPATTNVSNDDDLKKALDDWKTQLKEKKKDWKTKEKLYYKALLSQAVAAAKYTSALKTYCRDHSKEYKDLVEKRDKAEKAAKADNATQTDQNALKQAEDALNKLQGEMEKDFVKTPEGKQLNDDADKAGKELDKARNDMNTAKDAYDKANKAPRPGLNE
jgi:hypothetical protein